MIILDMNSSPACSQILQYDTVSAHGVNVSLPDGEQYTSKYAWDFGDPSGTYNTTLEGFNAAHRYETAGVYTIELRITTRNGTVVVKTKKVQVLLSATYRTSVSVATEAALAAVIGRRRYNITVTAPLTVSKTYTVGAQTIVKGNGSYPELSFPVQASRSFFIGNDSLIQGLQFYGPDHGARILSSLSVRTTLNDCIVRLVDSGIEAADVNGIHFENVRSIDADSFKGYLFWAGGTTAAGTHDVTIIGCLVHNSWFAHCVRTSPNCYRVMFAFNDLQNLDRRPTVPGDFDKQSATLHMARYQTVFNNTLRYGRCEIGPLGTKFEFLQDVQVVGNTMDFYTYNSLQISPGCDRLYIKANDITVDPAGDGGAYAIKVVSALPNGMNLRNAWIRGDNVYHRRGGGATPTIAMGRGNDLPTIRIGG